MIHRHICTTAAVFALAACSGVGDDSATADCKTFGGVESCRLADGGMVTRDVREDAVNDWRCGCQDPDGYSTAPADGFDITHLRCDPGSDARGDTAVVAAEACARETGKDCVCACAPYPLAPPITVAMRPTAGYDPDCWVAASATAPDAGI